MNTMSETTRSSRADVCHRARHQVMGLSAQFLFGMAIALIGQPSEATGPRTPPATCASWQATGGPDCCPEDFSVTS